MFSLTRTLIQLCRNTHSGKMWSRKQKSSQHLTEGYCISWGRGTEAAFLIFSEFKRINWWWAWAKGCSPDQPEKTSVRSEHSSKIPQKWPFPSLVRLWRDWWPRRESNHSATSEAQQLGTIPDNADDLEMKKRSLLKPESPQDACLYVQICGLQGCYSKGNSFH